MKTYLEIQVPLRYNASWFQELRFACQNIDVRWQMAYYHITMAFVDETPEDVDLRPLLEKHLKTFHVWNAYYQLDGNRCTSILSFTDREYSLRHECCRLCDGLLLSITCDIGQGKGSSHPIIGYSGVD